MTPAKARKILATLPAAEILAEADRIRTERGRGKPRVLKRCVKCGVEVLGAREFRRHRCEAA